MKNRVYLIACVCAVLGFLFIFVGTYSYYETSKNGLITAASSRFSFDVYHNDKQLGNINLFDTINSPSNREGNCIIPGDSGSFELVLVGSGSDVNLGYDLVLTGSNIPSNMKFYLDDLSSEINVDDYVISGLINYGSNMTKKHVIYWEWPYDSGYNNDLDYDYQGISFEINIVATGIQVN